MPNVKKADHEECCRTCKFLYVFENFSPEFKGTCSLRYNAPTKFDYVCEEYIFGDEEGLRVLDKSW